MLGPWILEVVSIPVHVHPADTIQNETRQTRQLVSSHQNLNGGVGGPRRGVKLCAVQSTKVHVWASVPKTHINDGPFNGSHADISYWPSIEICSNLRKCCTSNSFKVSRLSLTVPFFQGLFLVPPMSEI
ncbi:hypothetical protein AVEN_253070-1 [Araneus ventricosus]|uniref:Uncharacterized protein n=1 Tax=Araneus ventricosus TaxID=182803 RepID=A0A4Y2MK50_ARAVE|nr:hypothetical protein AVEN_253070-1 [Araneus ventricosus]